MIQRKSSLLPRSIRKRQRLNPREALWVYAPIPWLTAGIAMLAVGIYSGVSEPKGFEWAAFLFTVLGTLGCLTAAVIAFMVLDRESFSERKQRMLRDRPRRTREHKPDSNFRELKGRSPQYGVEVTRSGSDMQFAVLRYDPPQGGPISRHLAPWPCNQQRWSVSSEKWQVEGHILRVTNPKTHLLVEAYCEAAEAARAMESEEYDQVAKQVALEGMALAFTPPSRKTTNEEQLEAIRQRVQVRRLLDSGE